MAGDDGATERRRKGGSGFRRAAVAAEATLGAASAKRGFAEHRLISQWRALMGAEIAEACAPVRMSWPKGGRGEGGGATLTVEASGARAPEVQHEAARIVERVNQICGWRAVARLKVVQSGGARSREADAPRASAAPLDAANSPDISAIADDDLRRALARLGASIRAKAERN
ncbi:MAG: DUF721 domain-containing protein [Rubrimonas sp.]|uniref:DUF721 domain-containing protein n=1 Tax=Rubrimonas sp. TaxID=2036015 RepID=UPI002FDE0CFA